MTTFNELMESGKEMERKQKEGTLNDQDVIKMLDVLISWCETETTEDNLPINREVKE